MPVPKINISVKAEDSGKGAAGTSFTLTNNVQCTVSGIPSWVTGIATSYAAGTRTINPVAGVYYGRLQRSATITYSASGATSKTQTHTQSGYGDFFSGENKTYYVNESGCTVQLGVFRMNIEFLTYRGVENFILVDYFECMDEIGSVFAFSGADPYYSDYLDIPSDPGRSGVCHFWLQTTITPNPYTNARSGLCRVAIDINNRVDYTIIQSGLTSEIDISQQNM